mgnify:CR=1 FL=1
MKNRFTQKSQSQRRPNKHVPTSLRALGACCLLSISGCSEPSMDILVDHASFAVISGTVLEGGGVPIPEAVIIAVRGGEDCQTLPWENQPPATARTGPVGEFTIDVVYPLGPIGPGCVELELIEPSDVTLDAASSLLVPVVFSTSIPEDTAEVVIEVSRNSQLRRTPDPCKKP